jgi:hypothetical protein
MTYIVTGLFDNPESDALYCAEGVRVGGVFVAVSHCNDDEARKAADIMHRHGAIDTEQRGGARIYTHTAETPMQAEVYRREEYVTVEPMTGRDINRELEEEEEMRRREEARR